MSNVCEEQIFSSVFKANSKTVFNYIYYKFGNEEKANDAVQEAFVKLWENCAKVSPEKAKAYIYTVANNLYLNVIKAEKVRLKYADIHSKSTSNIDGKKYAEIAKMEGVSVKAIEKRMHLALKSLREKIDGI